MIMPRLRHGLVVLLVLLATSPVLAWDSKGHMMVAYIAYQQLTPAVRNRVDQLLALNPFHDQWLSKIPAGTPEAERKRRIFMLAATWPDEIKANGSGYTDDGSQNGNRPSGPASAQNVGYADRLRHRYWHFIDRPFSVDGTPLPPVPTPNAQERIHLFRGVMASTTASEDLKSYDLTWLLHLVGDVHQPLHSSTRVSANQPNGDQGGNLVHLCSPPCRDVLHAFWDDILGTQQTVTTAENLAKTLTVAPTAAANVLDEALWVQESFELAKNQVYENPIQAGAGPLKITPTYRTAARALARKQIALAGARLGKVLNAEIK